MKYTVDFTHQEITYLDKAALANIASYEDTGGLIDDEGNLHFATWKGLRLTEGDYPTIPNSILLRAIAPYIRGWVGFTLAEGLEAQFEFSEGCVLMESEE